MDSLHMFPASWPSTPKFGQYMPQTSLPLSIPQGTADPKMNSSGLKDTQIETNSSIL